MIKDFEEINYLNNRINDLKYRLLRSFLDDFPQYAEMTDTFDDILLEEEEIESWCKEHAREIVEVRNLEADLYFFEKKKGA